MSQKNTILPWPSYEEIHAAVNALTKEKLENTLLLLTRRMLKKGGDAMIAKDTVASSILTAEKHAKGVMTKERVVKMSTLPLLSEELFALTMESISPNARQVLKYIVDNDVVTYTEIKNKLGITVCDDRKPSDVDRRYSYMYYNTKLRILDEFDFIYGEPMEYGRNMSFSWSPELRRLLMIALNPTARVQGPLEGQDTLPEVPEGKELHVLQGEEHILRELPALTIYLNNKKIALSKKGRPNANGIKGTHKQMGLREFYPDTVQKDLIYLRSNMLVSMLVQLDKIPSHPSTADTIKHIFDSVYRVNFHSPFHLLHHINKMATLGSYSFKGVEKTLTQLIVDHTPIGRWVSFADFKERTRLAVISLNPIGYDAGKLTVDMPSAYSGRDWDVELYVYPYLKERLINWPLLRATVFLYAAWGLMDVAYDEPNCAVFSGTTDSPYDGLQYFRLTPLGAYVFGLSKDYISNVKQPFTLELAEDSLSVLVTDGDMELASKAIASFAKPVGPKRLQTNADLFLMNCTTAKDLETKISLFRSVFTAKLPPNWEKFFKEISQKVNPLKEIEGYGFFQLDAEDPTILQLIARDPDLKALCIKAEGHRILVADKDKTKLKNQLRKHGYLMA